MGPSITLCTATCKRVVGDWVACPLSLILLQLTWQPADAGFTHTAFTFGAESNVTRTSIDPNSVPPGSLITFIQKGLHYLELEANMDGQVGGFASWLLAPSSIGSALQTPLCVWCRRMSMVSSGC